MRNIPGERRSHLFRGGWLKSHMNLNMFSRFIITHIIITLLYNDGKKGHDVSNVVKEFQLQFAL
jgi:hypothetical protein